LPFALLQYVHECLESEVGLARWCMVIALNSLQSPVHDCPTLSSLSGQPAKPALKRQGTIESFGSEGGGGGGGSGGLGSREKGGGALTPVPEGLEGSAQDNGEDGVDGEESVKRDVAGGALRENRRYGGSSKRKSSSVAKGEFHVCDMYVPI